MTIASAVCTANASASNVSILAMKLPIRAWTSCWVEVPSRSQRSRGTAFTLSWISSLAVILARCPDDDPMQILDASRVSAGGAIKTTEALVTAVPRWIFDITWLVMRSMVG